VNRHDAQYFRRLNRMRDQRSALKVFEKMRRGVTLHLQHSNGRDLWSLSDGKFVSAAVARLVIANAFVVPAGDGLFEGVPGQSWRMCEEVEP
jgi:hypothetical protein